MTKLLAVAASGSEDLGVEIGGRPVGGDAVCGGNVCFWRRCRRRGLLCDLHRLGCSRLAVGGLRRPVGRGGLAQPVCRGRGLARACSRRALLNRRDRLCRDGLNGLGRGNVRCRCGRRLARTKNLGVEVGGGSIAGHAVHRLVRLLVLGRCLGRSRVVRRRTSGDDDRNRGQRGGGPNARQCAKQDVPPDRSIVGRWSSNKGWIWRGQGKE